MRILSEEIYIRAYEYFKDQLHWAKKKEDNDATISYYKEQIYNLMERYYSQ